MRTERSWGVVTMITPSRAMVCMTVRGASEVPGGRSMTSISASPHSVLFQNWPITLPIRGPRHTTGFDVSSMKRVIDITLMPSMGDVGGTSPVGTPRGMPFTPSMDGMEGPVMSASRMAVLWPSRERPMARRAATLLLPTPPLPLPTATICLKRPLVGTGMEQVAGSWSQEPWLGHPLHLLSLTNYTSFF